MSQGQATVVSKTYTVLFLCTGNSARSILAETLLNHRGAGRFVAYSAGSQPAGAVNPGAIAQLAQVGFPTEGLRSKSWDEFAGEDAPQFDFIITVCDSAAGESCPFWPGRPLTAHWGIPDPAVHEVGSDAAREAFHRAFLELEQRIDLLVALPDEKLDHLVALDTLAGIHSEVS